MGDIHRWWDRRSREVFWLEVTRREDIGANLKAPQTNERGEQFWSYSLVTEVREGDVIYHYDGNAQAIVARSLAVGIPWEDELMWAARGSSARNAKVVPHARRGWFFGLERYEPLAVPITLEHIRQKANALLELKNSLVREVGEPLYFPFELSGSRPVRPMQGYLFKLPSTSLSLFGIEPRTDIGVLGAARDAITARPGTLPLGSNYRWADEEAASAERDPFAVDPTLVDRGVSGHAITQNALASHVESLGLEPRSPGPHGPNFDLAWQDGDTIFVAEIKSLTETNEEKQLRLGLGQVLRYVHCLGERVRPVLAVERRPSDLSWAELCTQLGVILAWPEVFVERFARQR
jgi:hypothetical protein